MAKFIMICGLPGSGKTTLARKLEVDLQAIRFCPDEWLEPIFGSTDYVNCWEGYSTKREVFESMQLDMALRVAELGIHVVLENGFWSKEERDAFRAKAVARGFEVELYYLSVPVHELWARLEKRNQMLPPGTFHVTKSQLEEWSTWFEPPDEDEQVTIL